MTATVLFDRDCMLCRTLAGWAERRAPETMKFVAWQEFYQGANQSDMGAAQPVLRVLKESHVYDDEAAWQYLLQEFPDFSALRWLATRLGLEPKTAEMLKTAGTLARRFCLSCGRRTLFRSER